MSTNDPRTALIDGLDFRGYPEIGRPGQYIPYEGDARPVMPRPAEVTVETAKESAKEWMQKYHDERSAHEALKEEVSNLRKAWHTQVLRLERYERWIDKLLDRYVD